MKRESLTLPETNPVKAKFLEVVPEGDKWVFRKANTQRINLNADRKWLAEIDEWRKRQEWPQPSRSEAIRLLVDWAIDMQSKGNGGKPKKK